MRTTIRFGVAGAAFAAAACMGLGVLADDAPARPTYSAEGVVHVPAFDLPPSSFESKEAVDTLKRRARSVGGPPSNDLDIASARRSGEEHLAPFVNAMRQRYPVDVAEQTIAGVPARVITPKGKPFDQKRVLINLHGGGFSVCADACAMLESIPVASVGGFKVVSVNYRMGPEAAHPAALEDMAAVYRELLKQYKASDIGIYGCSAGGALTAESAAWLPAHGLPQAGAIGVFGAGGVPSGAGDSAYLAAYLDGSFPPPPVGGGPPPRMDRGYFDHADMDGPIVSPALHPDVLAKFPPTLLITGTRAEDLTAAAYTNSQLLKAGRRSTLIVGEGMGHCYIYMSQLPEAQDAYQEIVKFFGENLR